MDIEIKSEEPTGKHLNNLVAITVVIFAVFMAVSNIKGDNINQAMQRAKAEFVDAWAEYQAARIKLHVDENALSTLKLLETTAQIEKTLAASQASEYENDIKKYQERSRETRAKAERLEAEYEALNYRDDQFDLSRGFLSMAIAIAAIAALVQVSWVLYIAWATGAYGLLLGVAGFLNLSVRPAWLATLLGT